MISISDDEGLVYFNELLFGVMRRLYIEENNMNSVVYKQEQDTLEKIHENSIKAMKKGYYRQSRSQFLKKEGGANPFLTMMYLRITLRCWKKYTSKGRRSMNNCFRYGEREAIGIRGKGDDELSRDRFVR